MAKMYATEAAQRIVDRAVQLFGGLGVVRGSAVERLYRERARPPHLRGHHRDPEAHHRRRARRWSRGSRVVSLVFSPLRINTMTLPNRIVLPAMVTRLSGEDGVVNDDIRARYVRFARGGAGMVVHRGHGGPPVQERPAAPHRRRRVQAGPRRPREALPRRGPRAASSRRSSTSSRSRAPAGGRPSTC